MALNEQLYRTPLTKYEQGALVRAERTIAKGLKSFLTVGLALKQIRDQKLYRQDYRTFEEYVSQKWEISRPRAYELTAAANVMADLSAIADKGLPENEGQCRPLTLLKAPKHRRQAWRLALRMAGTGGRPVTARDVEAAVLRLNGQDQVIPFNGQPPRCDPTAQDHGVRYICGDAMEKLERLPGKFAQCCVTSPAYWGLRDYQTGHWKGGDTACNHDHKVSPCGKCGAVRRDRQIGIERTPKEYVDRLVSVFREVRRVLMDTGVLWLVLGDSYAGRERKHAARGTNLKPGNLLGLPWRAALAMQADGWILRQCCPWIKRNAMPESTKTRPTAACEYVLMLTKTADYFYDYRAVAKAAATSVNGNGKSVFGTVGGKVAKAPGRRHQDSGQPWQPHKNMMPDGQPPHGFHLSRAEGISEKSYTTRQRRNSDWFLESWQGLLTDGDYDPMAFVVNTQPLKEPHFAPFPVRLVEPCILACSRPGDVVLDPFCGSGTVGLAAVRHGREAVLIDLSPNHIAIAKRRVSAELCQLAPSE